MPRNYHTSEQRNIKLNKRYMTIFRNEEWWETSSVINERTIEYIIFGRHLVRI